MNAVKLEKGSFSLHLPLAKKYLSLGMTSFLSQISLVAAMMAIAIAAEKKKQEARKLTIVKCGSKFTT